MSEIITYRGKLIEVVEKPVGKRVFEYARRAPGVRLIIRNAKGEFLISAEYRHEHQRKDYRLPGGKVFDTLAEYDAARASATPMETYAMEAAQREGAEEVGLDINGLELLKISPCGATVVWDLYYFNVTDWAERAGGAEPEEGEDITVHWLPAAEVAAMCLDGRISEERSAATLLQLLKDKLVYREEGKQK